MYSLTEAKYLTDTERTRLVTYLEAHPCRDAYLIQLILYTGARGCEALAIRRHDFAYDSNGLCTVTLYGAKGSLDRTVPLPKTLGTQLRAFIEGMADNTKPFPIGTRQLRHIWDLYRPNPNKGIHTLRHTAGVLLYLNCHDINVVRVFLGHKCISNTMIYLDFCLGAKELKRNMHGMFNQKINE